LSFTICGWAWWKWSWKTDELHQCLFTYWCFNLLHVLSSSQPGSRCLSPPVPTCSFWRVCHGLWKHGLGSNEECTCSYQWQPEKHHQYRKSIWDSSIWELLQSHGWSLQWLE
jgi:hypothetical protein